MGANLAKNILSGILGPIALADLFSLLNLSKKTGCLSCTSGTVIKKVYWEDGEVVFARSNLREDSLGHYLVDRGIINEEQKEDSFRQIASGERHGKVLVRLGFLTPEQLLWGVRNQVQEILYTLFLWESGRFQFDEGKLEIREKVTLSASTTRIVMEGIRRVDEWKRIEAIITDMDAIPQKTDRPAGDDDILRPEDRKLLDLVDGRTSFREYQSRADIGSFEALAALSRLISAEYLTAGEPESKESDEIVFKVVGNP
jgi:hypothetical protein